MSDTALAPSPEPVASISTKGGELQLTNSAEMMRFASQVITSGLAPASFKTPAQVLVAMQMGAELGLKPMASLQHIAVISGRPSIYGKAVAGVVMRSGLCEDWREFIDGEGEKLTAVCRAKRKGLPEWKEARFSYEDAKRAGLLGKSGPWTQYFRDMLGHKARARCFGTLFADVLCGLPVMEDVREVYDAAPLADTPRPPSAPDPLLSGELKDATPEPEAPPLEVPAAPVDSLGLDRLNWVENALRLKTLPTLREACLEVAAWGDDGLTQEGLEPALLATVGGIKDASIQECRAFLAGVRDKLKGAV